MKIRLTGLFMGTVLVTLPVEFTADGGDSSETNIKLVGGGGQYALVSRGCEGEVLEKEKRTFTEIGGQVDHKFAIPVRIGLRSEYVSFKYPSPDFTATEIENALIFNPFVNLEGRKIAMGTGLFWSSNPLPRRGFDTFDPKGSFFFRYGDLRKTYLSVSILHSVPLFVEGFWNAGLGFSPSAKLSIWVGGNAGPYDHVGLLTKAHIRLSPQLYMNVLGRFGGSAEIFESGLAVGLSYRLRRK